MSPIEKKPFVQQSRPQGSWTSSQSRPAWQTSRPVGTWTTWTRPAWSQARPQWTWTSTQSRPAWQPFRPQASWTRPQWWASRWAMWWKDVRMTYINEMIKAPKVLLIDEQGEKLGVLSRDEALRRASSQWLDLVQLAYNPVEMICTAKIVDYGKYMYEKQKDDKEKKKNQKSKWSKEIKMSYTIWDNDLALKVQKAEEFLDDGYTVRFAVRLKWRERIFAEKVVEKLKGIEQTLGDKWKSQGVKEEPNGISLFLLPKGK